MWKQLTSIQRAQIIVLLEEGKSPKEIAIKFKIDRSTVVRTLQKYNSKKSFEHSKGNGRPKVLDSFLLAKIVEENEADPKKSLRKISKSLEKKHNTKISYSSVRNGLISTNRTAYSAINKPFLSKKNIISRFEFSKYVIKTSDELIKSIIFSDESKFELFNTKKRSFVWRKPGTGLQNKHLNPTVKFGGGSVMVWGCFSYYGVGKLVFIDGIMDAARYCNILANNLISSAKELNMNEFIFQQDNDPKHTSKLAKSYFEENKIKVMPWPAQSPDMNPIENLWGIIKVRVAELQPKTKEELKHAIISTWNEMTPEITMKLVNSFSERAIALYNAKGNHINY